MLTSHALRKAMNEVSDASYAGHQWNWREAYDAAEVAINLRVLAATNRATSAAEGGRRAIEAALGLARLETPQTQRAQATDGLQQFSTPIEIAIAVIEAARIRAGDTVLEPSAGTGVLATLAAAHLDEVHGGRLQVNEIDPQRAILLRRMFRKDMVSEKDAETLGETDTSPQPSVIVMNPPFTTRRSNGKMRRHADLAHLAAACRMVAPNGGRVVAVTSCNAEPGNERWNKAFDGINPAPAVRASIVTDGRMFRSRGNERAHAADDRGRRRRSSQADGFRDRGRRPIAARNRAGDRRRTPGGISRRDRPADDARGWRATSPLRTPTPDPTPKTSRGSRRRC